MEEQRKYFEKYNRTTLILNNKLLSKLPEKISYFTNLNFLSLPNNFLKDMDFLPKLPQLWYLDISNNPVV